MRVRLAAFVTTALALGLVVGVPVAAATVYDADGVPIRTVPRPGRVALTFDDGPNPTWTPVILDLLDEYQVKATFFVNGFRIAAYPDLAAEVARRGHSLQNHGYGHQRMTEVGDGTARLELVRGAEAIFADAGVVSTCFRPGWGLNSPRTRRITVEAHHATLLWTIDSHDYAHQSGARNIELVLDGIEPGDVVLMHESIGWAVRDSLPTIIAAVRAAGMEFDTVCDNRPIVFPLPPHRWGPGRGSSVR